LLRPLRKEEEEERANSQASNSRKNIRRNSAPFAFFISKIILKMQKKGLVEIIVPDDEVAV
jgi:hypothetical protein